MASSRITAGCSTVPERLRNCARADCAVFSDRFAELKSPSEVFAQFRSAADRRIDTDPASEVAAYPVPTYGTARRRQSSRTRRSGDSTVAWPRKPASHVWPGGARQQRARPRLASKRTSPPYISRPLNLLIQLVEFRPAGYKGGLGQRVAAIARADHDRRVRSAAAEPLVDRLQIVEHGLRGLVAVSRVFPQEPLDDFVERPRNRQAELRESRHGAGHLFEEDRTDRITLERRFTREATVQDKPRGIKIGRFRHVLVDQSGLLRET